MAECQTAGFITGWAGVLSRPWFVEAQTAAAERRLIACKIVNGGRFEIAFASVHSIVEQHLKKRRTIFCSCKKSGMTSHSTQHGRTLVVYKTVHQLMSPIGVIFCRGNL